MRTLIVGDIHGKVWAVKKALDQGVPVVFVGDILDSFEFEIEDHLECMDLIFEAIDEGKATCLYGNHEWSYLTHAMRCSGWNPKMAKYVDAIESGDLAETDIRYAGGLRAQMAKRFDLFQFYEPNILITHAGLDKYIWDKYNLTLETLPDTLAKWCSDPSSPAWWIGRSRGGRQPVGGIFWNDFQREHTPIPELIQVVGHTRGRGIRVNGTTTCIDCLDLNPDPCDFFYMDLPTEGDSSVQETVV